MANVKNRFDQTVSSDTDNAFRVGGTMDIESTSTFKIEGTTVTTTGLAEKLNNLDSVEEVANKSGGDYTKGTLVYISGYDATLDLPTVSKADADDATKKATLVLTEAIADNASGSAEPVATVTGLDTSSFSAVGSLVYESTTAGEFTATAPTDADDDRRVVGVVKVKDASVGSIYFFPGKGGLEHASVYLNNLTPGTVSATGAVVVDANKHQDVVNVTTLSIGASGSATAVTATADEINYNDITAVGTAEASKALVTDGSIDISGINVLGATTANFTDIDAGASGTAGSIDIFPTTASQGKASYVCVDQTGDTTITHSNDAMGQATTIHYGDLGLADDYVVRSTAQITATEADVLDGATAGTQVANKAIVTDANINQGIAKVTELHIGATGAETQVTSTGAELNKLDSSAETETIDSGVAIDPAKRITYIDNTTSGAGAITLAAPDASMLGLTKVIEMTVDNGDVTLSLTNVQGGSASTTCTWANVGEALVLVAGLAKWNVVSEGGVVLS